MTEFAIPALSDAVAEALPDRECIVFRDRRLTYGEVAERTRRFANFLLGEGFAVRAERAELAPHESGQDHLALYLHNGNEYVEAMLGAYKARAAPFNVNYRYVARELAHVLADGSPRGVVFHSAFAPTLAEVLPGVPSVRTLVQVPDESAEPLLPGAVWFEDALAGASAAPPPVTPSPDDLYIVYTGGTTGMPKGVLWRQADILVSGFNALDRERQREFTSLEDVVAYASENGLAWRTLTPAPFMHGAGHWSVFLAITTGGSCVVQDVVDRLDPADLWRAVERERVTYLLIVGEAYARPLVDELVSHAYDVSSLLLIASGGAVLSAATRRRLVELLPSTMIIDGVGASETGSQASHISVACDRPSILPRFRPQPGMCVLSEDRTRLLEPGTGQLGFVGQTGRVMLGYLDDPVKTAANLATVDGVRYVVSGDRARLLDTGEIELHGRDALTINTGGEKVFVEEVERALLQHPAVYDAVVCGRPSEQWGTEVAAVVQLAPGTVASVDELLTVAGEHVARYKLPKAVVFRDAIVRSPAGKPDYAWAVEQVRRVTDRGSVEEATLGPAPAGPHGGHWSAIGTSVDQ